MTVHHVNKLGNSLSDLKLVARYRVLEVPTWLIVDARGEVLHRHAGAVPTVREALAQIAAL